MSQNFKIDQPRVYTVKPVGWKTFFGQKREKYFYSKFPENVKTGSDRDMYIVQALSGEMSLCLKASKTSKPSFPQSLKPVNP